MKNFYNSQKIVFINCIDCNLKMERQSPNHKRCPRCARIIFLQRAKESAKKISPEKRRQNFRRWYYNNREKKIKQVREYQKTL